MEWKKKLEILYDAFDKGLEIRPIARKYRVSHVVCTVQKNAWMDGDALRICSEFANFANVSLMGT